MNAFEKNRVAAEAMQTVYRERNQRKAYTALNEGWDKLPGKRPELLDMFYDWAFDLQKDDPALAKAAIEQWTPRWIQVGTGYQRSGLDIWAAVKLQSQGQSDRAFDYADRAILTSPTKLRLSHGLAFLEIAESAGKLDYIPKILAATKSDPTDRMELKIAASEAYLRAGLVDQGRTTLQSLSIADFYAASPTQDHLRLQARLITVASQLGEADIALRTLRTWLANIHRHQSIAKQAFGEELSEYLCGLFDIDNANWTGATRHLAKVQENPGKLDPQLVGAIREIVSIGNFRATSPSTLEARIRIAAVQVKKIDDLEARGSSLAMLSTMAAIKSSPSTAASLADEALDNLPEGVTRQAYLPQLKLNLAMGQWLEGNRERAIELARESRSLAADLEIEQGLDDLLRRLEEAEVVDESILTATGRIFPLVPVGANLVVVVPIEQSPKRPLEPPTS